MHFINHIYGLCIYIYVCLYLHFIYICTFSAFVNVFVLAEFSWPKHKRQKNQNGESTFKRGCKMYLLYSLRCYNWYSEYLIIKETKSIYISQCPRQNKIPWVDHYLQVEVFPRRFPHVSIIHSLIMTSIQYVDTILLFPFLCKTSFPSSILWLWQTWLVENS